MGFEPQVKDDTKRALTDAITHMPPVERTITYEMRELPTITTVTATVTGSQTFYSCSNGWVLTSGVAGASSSPANTALVPTVSGGSGAHRLLS